MADPTYCPLFLEAPCLKPEVWAAWAQAFLATASILATGFIPTWQQGRRDAQTTRAYIRLVEHAEATATKFLGQVDELKLEPSREVMGGELPGFPTSVEEAFGFIRFDQLTSYDLLEPLSEAQQAVKRFRERWSSLKTDGQLRMIHRDAFEGRIKELEFHRGILRKCVIQMRSAS
ncbi:hypothetical protein [Xanthomonas sp. 3058]|uniref:hypothetical protein n=1 Tax=Xanthomonas sp. 3058 TaxID=3035314 RepID=UPI00160E4371|nr:hypothetical protein [Xanthomonas sp. 3058]MBB5862616.1 hypothetical protein [Xanthomonas sp. 3058]